MVDRDAVINRSLKVFISYSRKDIEFAEELLAGLELAAFEPYLDKHDIAPGEDWELRLDRLIAAADTVVFVISPDAVNSDRCAWEVNRAIDLSKRILPVVLHRVEEAQVPLSLKQLNCIFFDRPYSFGLALRTLTNALRTDIEWIREHTRIGEAARRWNERGRNEALLFRGDELAAAMSWLASPPAHAPEPTILHHAFIKSGGDAETARSTEERRQLDEMRALLDREQVAQSERETALRRERSALDRIKREQVARFQYIFALAMLFAFDPGGLISTSVLLVLVLGCAAFPTTMMHYFGGGIGDPRSEGET